MNKQLQYTENKQNTPYLFNDFGGVKILYPERTARRAELDKETGLYYYGARYYEQRISLWLSVDPLWDRSPERSVYEYTFSNPINYIDPTGLTGEEPGEECGGEGEPPCVGGGTGAGLQWSKQNTSIYKK
ncbi:MAG: RHS repeat-associated core domain-containing protein [Flavobacteriales bacterium]